MTLDINQIYCGDCLDLMKEIPDESVDLVLTDPPYNQTQNEWDKDINLSNLFSEVNRVIKENGAIIITSEGVFTADIIKANEKYFKYTLIWDKKSTTGFLNANRLPLRQHEIICVFYKNLPCYNPQMTKGKERYKGGKKYKNNGCYGTFEPLKKQKYNEYFPTSIISISNSDQWIKEHPTQKPIPLFEYFINTYSNPGDLILDPFLGSGTTAVACKKTNRNFIGIEKEPKYVEIALKRLEKVNNKRLTDFSTLEGVIV